MREIGMLLSPPMVLARLAGRKTMTRRIITPQPTQDKHGPPWGGDSWQWHAGKVLERAGYGAPYVHTGRDAMVRAMLTVSPYQVGDRIYWREAWRAPENLDAKNASQIAQDCLAAGYSTPWCPIKWEADGGLSNAGDWNNWTPGEQRAKPGRYRHARFMPRWAARLVDEIVVVRAEPLQEITENDAIAEGIYKPAGSQFWHADPNGSSLPGYDPVMAYRNLWEYLNGEGSWDANPWVWVISWRPA